MTAWDIAALFEDLELRLIESLKRNLARHKAEEKKEGLDWAAWQAEKLRSLWRFRRENAAILGQYAEKIDAGTRRLLQEQFSESADPEMSDRAFFGVNGRKLDALINEMAHNERRAEKAALRYMDDQYRRTLLRAAASLSAGGMTVRQAVDMAARDFLARGICCIQYRDGRRVNVAAYAEMALRTANTRAMLLGEAQRREALGVDTVLVSEYGGCSETCLPWQGLVYIDDVWGAPHPPAGFSEARSDGLRRGQREGNPGMGGTYGRSRNGRSYPLLSVAVKGGLFHPNCRHTLTTWIEGISQRPAPVDKAEAERAAKLEQRQRALERRVRQYKRLAAGTLDPEKAKAYRAKARDAQRAVREFVARHGDVLRRDYWREREDGAHVFNTTAAFPSHLINSSFESEPLHTFDSQKILEQYRSFINSLTNIPGHLKMYLDYYVNKNPVALVNNPDLKSAFAYAEANDTLYYNPAAPNFKMFDVNRALTHEMGHRIDRNALHSFNHEAFISAVNNAKDKVQNNPTRYAKLAKDIGNMFFFDIIDAFSDGKNPDLDYGHGEAYYKKKGNAERELYANLFLFEVYSEEDIIKQIQTEFPEVWNAYLKLYQVL